MNRTDLVLGIIQIGVGQLPRIIQLLRTPPPDPEKIEPLTLEYLLELGYSLDEATLILAEHMQEEP